MSNPIHLKRAGRAGIALAVGFAFAAVPVAAQAAPVLLGSTDSFSVLGGSTVTNTGPSVLNGDLGVSPGLAITGFGPGIVNGATYAGGGVAGQAQSDLTSAYNTAAGEPTDVDLTGQDLGGLTLTTGTYAFATSAQLTGTLVLNAQGDPNARFIIKTGSTLTTASNSVVSLINGATPCNVFWQVGSSATLGTTTAFQGNILALTSITMTTDATLVGRALARNGAVTLDSNVVTASTCVTPPPPDDTPTPTPVPGPVSPGGTPATTSVSADGTPSSTTDQAPPASRSGVPTRNGTAILRPTPRTPGSPGSPGTPGRAAACTEGFSASVRGRQIKRVVFSLDGRRIASRSGSPFRVLVKALPGKHKVTARVTFKDATRAKTLSLGYRACAAAVLQPRRGPSQFTG